MKRIIEGKMEERKTNDGKTKSRGKNKIVELSHLKKNNRKKKPQRSRNKTQTKNENYAYVNVFFFELM